MLFGIEKCYIEPYIYQGKKNEKGEFEDTFTKLEDRSDLEYDFKHH